MTGLLAALRAASPSRAVVGVVLDGGAQAEWDDLNAQLQDAAQSDARNSLADLPETTRVVEAMEEVRERVAASRVEFHLEALDWTDRVALQAEHPPRPGNLVDRISGYNIDTFTPALIRASTISIVGVDGEELTEIPDDVWVNLLGRPATEDEPKVKGSLNYKAVSDLTARSNKANDGETSVPPSARSLLGSRDSGASLAQPSPGTSAPADSAAGSRPGSPRSRTTKKAPSKARSTGT